jgi:electron transfer flavoprotein beta subunit
VTDINADLSRCGLVGSPTKVKNIQNVVLTARETRMVKNTDQDISGLMRELITEHILG